MPEPVLLGEILPEVLSDIARRMAEYRKQKAFEIDAGKPIIAATDNGLRPVARHPRHVQRDTKNDCRHTNSTIAHAGHKLAEAKAKHRQKPDRPTKKQIQYLYIRSRPSG